MKRKSVTYSALDVVLTGKRIDSLIKDNECSVRELQMILNLSCPQSIYRWIRGRTLPSVDNLMAPSDIGFACVFGNIGKLHRTEQGI